MKLPSLIKGVASTVSEIVGVFNIVAHSGGLLTIGDGIAAIAEGFGMSAAAASTFAAALGPVAAGIAVIVGLGIVTDALTESFDEAVEKADKSRSAFNDAQSELDSLSSQLSTNQTRIAELRAQGPITITEQSEIVKLEQENVLLEQQIALKERLAGYSLEQAVSDATNVLTKGAYTFLPEGYTPPKEVSRNYTPPTEQLDIIDATARKQRELNALDIAYIDAQKELRETDAEVGSSEYTRLSNRVETLRQMRDDKAAEIDSMYDIISAQESVLAMAPDDPVAQTQLERIYELQRLLGLRDVKGNDYWSKYYGGVTDAADATDQATSSLTTYADALKDAEGNASEFSNGLDKYTTNVSKLQEALRKLRSGEFEESDLADLIREFPELAGETDDLEGAIRNLLGTMNESTIDSFNAKIQEMVDAGADPAEIAKMYALRDAIIAIGEAAADTSVNIAEETELIDKLQTAMSESNSGTGLTADSIKALQARYKDLAGYDPSKLFERTANGIHLNRDALDELERAYITTNKNKNWEKLQEYLKQYEELQEKIDSTSDAAQRASLISQQQSLAGRIEECKNLAAEYDALTSAYNRWKFAQSSGNESDMYRDIAGNLDSVQESIDQGWITNDIRQFVDLLSSKDLATASVTEIKAEWDRLGKTIEGTNYSVRDFFTFDDDNNLTSTGLANFLEACQQIDDTVVSWDGKQWNIDFGLGKDAEMAERLGIDVELLQSMLRALVDSGDFHINLDSIWDDIGLIKTQAERSVDTLEELFAPYKIDIDSSELDNARQQMDDLAQQYNGLVNGNVDYSKRPVVSRARMQTVYPEFDGDYATTYDADSEYTDKSGTTFTVKYTPILENGEVLSPEAVDGYMKDIFSGASGMDEILEADANGKKIIINIEEGSYEDNIDKLSALDEKLQTIKNSHLDLKQFVDAASFDWDAFNFESTDVDDLVSQLQMAQGLYEYLTQDLGLSVDSSEVLAAQDILVAVQRQLQEITKPKVLSVSTEGLSGDQQDFLEKANNLNTAYNDYQIKLSVGADTTQAEQDVDAALAELQGTNAVINGDVELDTTSAQSAIDGLDGETVQAYVGLSVKDGGVGDVTGETDGGERTTTFTPDDSALAPVQNETNGGTRVVTYTANTASLPTSFPSITRYVNYVKTGNVNESEVNGTANVNGTAAAGGRWGTTRRMNALTGELGREILVDPNSGTWQTIGNNGAEFVDVPQGAIIFNHRQTEALLKYGKVAGRGRALLSGTAFSNGYGGFIGSGGSSNRRPNSGGSSWSGSSSSSSGSSKSSSGKSSSSSSSSYKSSSSSSSSSSASDDAETLDWIEVLLDRISRRIDSFNRKFSSAFRSIGDRIASAKDELAALHYQMDSAAAGAERYLQAANAVGLDESWAAKVRDGLIDIEEITDETLKDNISKYQDFYEKYLDCLDQVDETQEEISQRYLDIMDTIATHFENSVARIQHSADLVETELSTIEAMGYEVNERFYGGQLENAQARAAVLNQELAELKDAFEDAMANGNIEEGSEAWHEMQEHIEDVESSLAETNQELAETQQTMREIANTRFDNLIDKLGRLNDESKFLQDLLKSGHDMFDEDTAEMTAQGLATMGLLVQDYATAMQQANDLAEERIALEQRLAEDPANVELSDRLDEIIDKQQDVISNAYSTRDAIKSMVEDGIKAQLDALKKLIDEYEEALDSAKDLHDYQQKIEDQTKNISQIERQLRAYAGDDSEEARKRLQELRNDLADAQRDLEDTQYDQYLSDQKKLLDDMYDEYEENLNARLDDIDALIEEVIGNIQDRGGEIQEAIQSAASAVGYELTDPTAQVWRNVTDIRETLSVISEDLRNYLTGRGLTGYETHHSGGIAGIGALRQNEVLAKLMKGEYVLTPEQLATIIPNAAVSGAVARNLQNVAGMSGVKNYYTQLDITLPNVTNYDEFWNQAKKDPNVSQFICAVSTDRLSGGSKLAKNRVRFK